MIVFQFDYNNICWKDFEAQLAKLPTGELDLNELRTIHDRYLNKAKSRYLFNRLLLFTILSSYFIITTYNFIGVCYTKKQDLCLKFCIVCLI